MAQLSSPPESRVAESPSEAELSEHLETICSSKAFENSATLKNLLRYLFENKDRQLSEYGLAVEALHRKPEFDPQVDATVRVQISRLRRRLKDFYLGEGQSLALRFSVPLGTHQLALGELSHENEPRFPARAEASASRALALARPLNIDAPKSEAKKLSQLSVLLIAAVTLLTAVCAWQFLKITSQAKALAAQSGAAAQSGTDADSKPMLLPFWQEFSANAKPIQIVIPNPTFFSWGSKSAGGLMVRDTAVNNFAEIDRSPELAMLQKRLGKPQLSQHYAVSSDVIASLKLLHSMDAAGLKTDLAISSDASADSFEGANVILVGTPGTLTPFKNQLDRLYFKFDPQGFNIQNLQPHAGEPGNYLLVNESPVRNIYPGLIAELPGIAKDSHVLILAGQQTAALVSFLTSTSGSRQLMEARRKAGGGPYFEAVILSETGGSTILNNRLMAVHTYPTAR